MSGGFSMDAIKVVRNNRSLLKKRKFKDIKNLVIESSGKTELDFKQISHEELELIKQKIRKDAKKAAETEITIFGLLIIVIAIICGWIYLMTA